MDEPKFVIEALLSPERDELLKAMKEELEPNKTNKVYDQVDLPKARKVVTNKWILKVKSDGLIDWHKAWLVAKGLTQEFGKDYEENFSNIWGKVSRYQSNPGRDH